MKFGSEQIIETLKETALRINWDCDVEILIIGGVAAMLTGQLSPERVTQDCDIINLTPEKAQKAISDAASEVANIKHLPDNWLSFQAMHLNVLPDGWKSRRVLVYQYGKISIYAASRLDLLCTKFYANRPQDREDILEMKPTKEELSYVRSYLDMLKLPSRHANLDQIVTAQELVKTMEGFLNGK